MKKVLTVLCLVLVMVTSLVAGTLAVYNTTLDTLSGDVVAKSFDASLEGTLNFEEGIKLAPSESGEFKFEVKNFNNTFTTETDMLVTLNVEINAEAAIDGKAAPDLRLSAPTGSTNANIVKNSDTSYTITVTLAKGEQITEEFAVSVTWVPGNDDIAYAGKKLGALSVSGNATQA